MKASLYRDAMHPGVRLPNRMRRSACFAVLLALLAALPSAAAPRKKPVEAPAPAAQTFAEMISGLERRSGLLTVYLDRKAGKVWLEVPPAKAGSDEVGSDEVGSYLYTEALRTGLGSNPVGLDRGQLGVFSVVNLRRVGGRLLIEQPNLRFRALSENPEELRAVRESFATSIAWAGEIAAEDPDGRALVDITGFLVRDAHGVVAQLRQTGQGNWQLDAARSVADLDKCLAFPENVEMESLLTYSSPEPGQLVILTAPLPGA